MTSAVCTLFEGHYHLGAAGLVNSLWASGFRGRVLCGYRGPLPFWSQPSRREENGITVRDLGEGFEIWFVPVDTKIHFTNYKPTFLLQTWEHAAGNPDVYYYLDPDIVLRCPWTTLERWAEGGLALSEDVNFYLPPRHPQRTAWRQWLGENGIALNGPPRERYYSAGFIGVPRPLKNFLTLWENVIAKIGETTGSLAMLKQGNATALFHTPDQDAMNIAIMCAPIEVNGAGSESMDFAPGGHMLSHAIGPRKPWRGGFIRQALSGYPPSLPTKSFFQNVTAPIPVFSPGQKSRFEFALKIAAIIGRFYRRA